LDAITRKQRAEAVTRATAVGALSNVVLSAVKIAAGWIGQSHALIADGVHSLSDLASDVLVWLLAGRRARRRTTNIPMAMAATKRSPRWRSAPSW
jgi:divalent metal cation (Fe/Co/Zn/Cd) transporter